MHSGDIILAETRLVRVRSLLARNAFVLARPVEGKPIVGGHKLIFDARPAHLLSDITEVLGGIPTVGISEERTKIAIDLARAGLKDPSQLDSAREKLLDAIDGSAASKLTLDDPQLKHSFLSGYAIPDVYYSPDGYYEL